MRKWVRVPGTNNWAYEDESGKKRHITVREPYMNEPDGTKYDVTGEGHEYSQHDSLPEAMTAAEASLDSKTLDDG